MSLLVINYLGVTFDINTSIKIGSSILSSSGSFNTSGGTPAVPHALPVLVCLDARSNSDQVNGFMEMSRGPSTIGSGSKLSEGRWSLLSSFLKCSSQPTRISSGLEPFILAVGLLFLPDRLLTAFHTALLFLVSSATLISLIWASIYAFWFSTC